MSNRLLFNGGVLVSVIFFPAWITVFLLLLMLLFIRAQVFEVIIWGATLDFLYGVYLSGFPYLPILFILTALGLFVAVELLKPHLVFYER